MADTTPQALGQLASNSAKSSTGVDKLTSSLKKLGPLAAKDIININNLNKAIKENIQVTKQYAKIKAELEKKVNSGNEATEKEIENCEKWAKVERKSASIVKDAHNQVTDAIDRKQKSQDKTYAAALENFRTNTLLGKSYGVLTSHVTNLAAKFGFLGLAGMALTRHIKAANVQQDIMIQSYRGLSSDIVDFTDKSMDLSKAMAKSEATAQRMGVSTEYVTEAYTKFARIVGTSSPKVLGTLTEGAITVSKSLGISVPEAIDFVSTRMDKFGGSAASAIASLNNIREETKSVNDAFGRTVVRGDDVARTLLDISKQTTMYAIDQRFVGSILRDNISKLQSNGDSYEQASKKAKAFTEAVTGKAPEWMKVFSAQDIYSQIAEISPEQFVSQFGSELEAAKPGLTKEVQSILNDKNMGQYSKMMLLQEMLSGTTVGINSMNKQILKLANHPQGVALIAKQFGVTLAEAQGMVTQAKALDEQTKVINKLNAQGIVSLREKFKLGDKEYTLSQDQADEVTRAGEAAKATAKFAAMKTGQTIKNSEVEAAGNAARKAAIKSILDQKQQEQNIENDLARMKSEEIANDKAILGINQQITDLSKKKADMQKKIASMPEGKEKEELQKDMDRIDKLIKGKELDRTRYESKAAEAKGATAGLKTVEEINKQLLTDFQGYSVNTGGYFKAMITEMSDTKGLLIAAGVMGFGQILLKQTGAVGRIEKLLAEYTAGKLAGGGGINEHGGSGGTYGPMPKETWKQKAGKLKDRVSGAGKSALSTARHPIKAVGAVSKAYGALDDTGRMAVTAGVTTAAFGLSKAMDSLTTKYDESGNEIETANSKTAKSFKQFSGTIGAFSSGLAGMPGKLGKLGGAMGMLEAAWETGVSIGQGLNTVFDKMGWTGEETTQRMADWWTKDDNKKGKDDANKKMIDTLMKKGISEQDATKAIAIQQKEGLPIAKALEKMGKTLGKPTARSPITGIPIPSGMGAIGNTAATTTAAQAATAAVTAAAAGQAATTANSVADAGAGGMPEGVLTTNGAGVTTIVIKNFKDSYAKTAASVAKGRNFAS